SMISYLERHRNGLRKAAGITGGLYLVRGYVKERLEEVKEKMEQERLAREILHRRYEQTQEDVGYTVMALLSNLGEQILEEMDVEAVIGELQTMSNKTSVAGGSDSLAASITSAASESSGLSTSGLQGWVDATASQAQSPVDSSSSEEASSVMSSSFITNISTSESEPGSSSASVASLPSTSSGPTSRTKAQLWNSVKLLTFTRTLTTMYSTSLLSLLTLTQLTILARVKYIHAIRQMSSEEDQDVALHGEMTMPNMLLMAVKAQLDDDDRSFEHASSSDMTFESLSADYLTLSYYLLHIGWKDLSTRVQPAVEDALEGVSLKTRFTRSDVHRLLKDIMHRVTLESSFETALLPNTEEMVRNVLVLGGRDDPGSYSSSKTPSAFDDLLLETRALFASPQFGDLVDACVDRALDSLMDSLEAEGCVLAPGDDSEPPRVRLASILPPLASWSRTSLLGLPSELVDGLLARNEVRTYSAWVWSRFELEV
ncbi:Peroxin-3, partial [Rhodocollybia butyracea]